MRVKFYSRQDGQLIEGPYVNNSNKWAGGGLLCSISDLIRFGQNLLPRREYLKAETLAEFTTSQVTRDGELTGYGMGFSTREDTLGRRWFGHSGGSVGGTSMLLVYPEEELVIVTLVNLTSAEMDDLAWKIADLLREEKNR
jgi:CubicO group peptidase (beta-lactamase class C family)